MATTEIQRCDAIIIGAGISGLVCGCYLAKAGLQVVIVEQHDKPGGYFTSFKRKGFVFDAAAHSFGNYRKEGHVRKILTELGVHDILTINRCDPSDIVVTPDKTITYWNDVRTTMAELIGSFPHEEKGIINFFNFLSTAGIADFVRLKDKTFDYLLRSFFHDEGLMSALALPVFGNGGLPPSLMNAFSGAKVFSEFIVDGGYYPSTGIQALPNALAQIFTRAGGKIIYKKLVSKILIQGGSACGVEMNGETVHARCVVSACDMSETYKRLIGEEQTGNVTLARINKMQPSLSTFILYMGIDRPFEQLPKAGTNTWYLFDSDLNKIYSQVLQCDFGNINAFMFRTAPDCRTALAFIGAPFNDGPYWKTNKQVITEQFRTRVEKAIPDLKDHVVYIEAATPATLERYTLNYRGAAFGWAKVPSQTSEIMSSKVSGVENLYFTGHWTSIGFGMPGTSYSGYETARRILKRQTTVKQSQSVKA
jgi:phytoene dehydrogenase-like protein